MSLAAVLPMLKKALPYVAGLSAIVGILTYVYNLGGDVREANIRAELTEKFEKQVESNNKEAERAHRAALSILEADAAASIESLRAELYLERQKKRQIQYVPEIIIDESCKRLALDVIGLFQQPADADSG